MQFPFLTKKVVARAWRVTWGVFLGGCTPLGLWLYEDPVVTVSQVTLQLGRAQLPESPVIVALALNNGNDYPLSTERLELSLHLDGVPIGQLRRDSTMPVANETVSTVALPLRVAKASVARHLRTLESGTHTFAIRGRATFRTPFGSRKVRFAQVGSLIFGERPRASTP